MSGVITAETQADEEFDQELLRQLKARREARRRRRKRNQPFPSHLERRIRLLDLPDDKKAGLRCWASRSRSGYGLKSPTSLWKKSIGTST